MFKVGIVGTGSYLARRKVGNEEFDKYGSNVRQRLDNIGIKERRWASEDEKLPVMAAVAVQLALEDSNLSIGDIDGIYCGTNSTDDYLVPSIASRVQRILGAPEMPAMDLGVGCSGALQAIRCGLTELFYKTRIEESTKPLYIVAFGGDVLENITKTSSPVTRGILADGAGAVVLSVLPETQKDLGIYNVFTRSHGELSHLISYTSGYGQTPSGFLMNGREVHKFVMRETPGMVKEIFDKSKVNISELEKAIVAPHQINAESLERLPRRLKEELHYAPKDENFYKNGAIFHGNTSGASALISLDDLNRSGKLSQGDLVMLLVWGAGMTKGSLLMRWNKPEPAKRKFEDREEQERLVKLFSSEYQKFENEIVKIKEREFS